MVPFVPSIFAFLHLVLTDSERTEALVRSSVGLIGDLASEFKGQIKDVLIQDWVTESIKVARTRVGNQETKNVAKWAREVRQFPMLALIVSTSPIEPRRLMVSLVYTQMVRQATK